MYRLLIIFKIVQSGNREYKKYYKKIKRQPQYRDCSGNVNLLKHGWRFKKTEDSQTYYQWK